MTFAGVVFLLPTPAPQPNSIYPPSVMTGVGNYGLPILIVGLIGLVIGTFMIIKIFREVK